MDKPSTSTGGSNRRIFLFLMGTAHLIMSTGIGIGIGFAIGYGKGSSDNNALQHHDVEVSSSGISFNTVKEEHPFRRRSLPAVPVGKKGGLLLRGKTDLTLKPTGTLAMERPPTASSSKSSKKPSPSPAPPGTPEIQFPSEATPTTTVTPATRGPTGNPTSNPTNVAATRGPTGNPVAAPVDTLSPTSIATSSMPVGTQTNAPTAKDKDLATPSSADVKCTCMPSLANGDDSTASPSAIVNVEATASPSSPGTFNQATLSPSATATTSSPTSACGHFEKESCCNQPSMTPEEDQERVCHKLGCNLQECQNDPKTELTSGPTISPRDNSSNVPTLDTTPTCGAITEETCCNQPSTRPLDDQERICQELGCNLNQCPAGNPPTTDPAVAKNSAEPTTNYAPYAPSSRVPSIAFTESPMAPAVVATTYGPTKAPSSSSITESPSFELTYFKTDAPTPSPTEVPSAEPTSPPTNEPISSPTSSPSAEPTPKPSFNPTKQPTPTPSSKPTSAPTKKPTLSPTRVPSGEPTPTPPTEWPTESPVTGHPTMVPSTSPTTLSPSRSPSAKPTLAPTDEPTVSTSSPSESVSPSSAPPSSQVPARSDTLTPTTIIPTANPSKAPAIELIITMGPGTAQPTHESSYGGTPTVSKETSAAPTVLPNRPASVKQLGSNDYKPHYVYTSKVETECSREKDDGEDTDGSEDEGGCVLHCEETTRLYEGDAILSETRRFFEIDCPDYADGEDDVDS